MRSNKPLLPSAQALARSGSHAARDAAAAQRRVGSRSVLPIGPDVREKIVSQYAEWSALSALRSGAPIKSRRDVYSALRAVDFAPLFEKARGPMSGAEFNAWHERAVLCLLQRDPRLIVGWATKILNVYLKTRCYIGAFGRHHLSEAIHPPIDAGLWLGLHRRFQDRPDILIETHCVSRIKDIEDYACYRRIITGCRIAARALGCKLIEVEQLWAGTEFDERVHGAKPNRS